MVVSEQQKMNNESPFQGQPAYIQKTPNRKRLVIIFLVVLLLVIAALGALYLLGTPAKRSPVVTTNPLPTQTISATPEASAAAQVSTTPATTMTVAPTTSPAALIISVLNGSGVPGAAQKTASALTAAGYTSVTTGNAASYTYNGITIHVKKSTSLAALQKVVNDTNPNVKVITGVDDTMTSDAEIIVGK